MSDWLATMKTADEEIKYSLKILQGRSRNLAMNNDYAKKYIKMCVANIVGPNGVVFQNKSRNERGTLDIPANLRIEEHFLEWGKKGSCTADGKLSWIDIQRLIIETVAKDGEVFINLVRNQEINKYGLSLQLIESEYIDTQYNKDLENNKKIRLGIEFDKWNKPQAYYITKKANTMQYVRIPAENIIHLYICERPNQSRGVPWMHTAMTRLHRLGGYEEAALMKARIAACEALFITQSEESAFGSSVENEDKIIDLEPGLIQKLAPGQNIVDWNPQYPTGEFDPFMKRLLKGIASGLNISYNSLASDLESVSYSSIRSGSIEERDSWRILQNWFTINFCQIIFEKWLESALILNAIGLPFSKFKKFNAPRWYVRGWQWVDPLKDAKANIDSIDSGLKTRSQVIAEQGYDVEDVFEELQHEKELAEQYGLEFKNPKKEGITYQVNE